MKVQEVMESARLKVSRANRHIDEINADQSALPMRLYDLGVTHRSVALLREPDCDLVTYIPKQSISKHFGAIAGDVVNNLRESMDVWINTAVRCVGPVKKLHFPFSEERQNLEASGNFRNVEKAFPDAADFISKKIEPCRNTNLYLWAATSLCNANKHNDFIPVVGLSQIKGKNIQIGSVNIGELAASGDANKPQTLICAPYKGFSIEDDFKATVEVSFPKGAVFEDQLIVPTLVKMSDVVTETLDALEVFIRPYCK
jgi:hypothetical protein